MATKAMELKRKIHEQKEVVIGLYCETNDPILVEAAGKTKLCEFIVIELEHSPYYADKVLELVRAAECADLVPIVRVPDSNGVIIQKVLDVGVKGISVPRLRTAKELRDAIAATRYQPEGTRGATTIVRGAGFTPIEKWAQKAKELNEEVIVFCLPWETLDAINNLEEIISTPGLDCFGLSIVDITHALGHVGEIDHPEVREVQKKAMELGKKYNVPFYGVPQRVGMFDYWYNQGVRVFIADDISLFLHGFRDLSNRSEEWAAHYRKQQS